MLFVASCMRGILGICIIAMTLFHGVALASPEQPSDTTKWHGWWELGGYYGSEESSRGEVTIFQPLGQTATSLFFADVRGKFFEADTQEG